MNDQQDTTTRVVHTELLSLENRKKLHIDNYNINILCDIMIY